MLYKKKNKKYCRNHNIMTKIQFHIHARGVERYVTVRINVIFSKQQRKSSYQDLARDSLCFQTIRRFMEDYLCLIAD